MITGMIDVLRSLFQLGPYPGRNSPAQGLSEHRSSQDAHIHPHLARDERSSMYVWRCSARTCGSAPSHLGGRYTFKLPRDRWGTSIPLFTKGEKQEDS